MIIGANSKRCAWQYLSFVCSTKISASWNCTRRSVSTVEREGMGECCNVSVARQAPRAAQMLVMVAL